MAIIAETLRAFSAGELTQESERYPIVKIYKYADKISMSGVMATASAATQYAIVLRTQFVPEGEVEGPYRDIYYKILPAGSTNMSVGGILGMPVLDVQPYGLGWRVCPTVHVFDALGVSLARGELAARERYHAALEQDRLELRQEQARRRSRRQGEPDQSEDEINELVEISHRHVEACRQHYGGTTPNACIAVDHLLLSPGDQAVVPVRFDKAPPTQDFMVESLPEGLCALEVLPGLCPGGVKELPLCLANCGVTDVTLDRGDVVATVVPEIGVKGGRVVAKPKAGLGRWR